MKFLFLLTVFMSTNLFAGHEVGNGGDEIRMIFVEQAQKVLRTNEDSIIKVLGHRALAEMEKVEVESRIRFSFVQSDADNRRLK